MHSPAPIWLESLKSHLTTVHDSTLRPDGSARLLAALQEIEKVLSLHRAAMPNDLVHYLERRSYEKASNFCQKMTSVETGE